MSLVPEPQSVSELMHRARTYAGKRLVDLGASRALLKASKGGVGQFMERALGATARTADEPDFQKLGIELKTLPVDHHGKPREVTYVCRVSFAQVADERWETSRVRRKLARVLFVPIENHPDIPIEQRRMGTPCLFNLAEPLESILRADWEELAGQIGAGAVATLTARVGRYLHIRPKAAHSRVRALAPAQDGGSQWANPRGYYLRKSFTQRILAEAGLHRPADDPWHSAASLLY